MGLIIRQGKILYKNNWMVGDIFIEDGIIKEISEEITTVGHQIIHAKGNIVVPGFIDMHVHLREPGFEGKETIETGTMAAVRGGFTTVAAMPNTKPVIDTTERVNDFKKQAEQTGYAKVLPIGAITKGEQGEELVDMEGMSQAGVIGFSDDGKGIQTSLMMKSAMAKAQNLKLPIIAHCEDESLVEGGVIHKGMIAERLNVPGIPPESEYTQIARDILLADVTGVHYHICHVSTKESVQLIRLAKEKGVKVSAEVTPHHLLLEDVDIKEPYTQYKMNPPLRAMEDRLALIEGLIDGTIDIIATDHAPHTEEEKKRDLLNAPFGIVGLETAFPLLYTHLVKKDMLSLEGLIERLTLKPASLFHLKSGKIEVGEQADITIIDLDTKRMVQREKFSSKGRNTPFQGWELYGWPKYTIVDGKIKWEDGEVH